jgi:RNA polymerase sigma factor (sigma-70 family)
MVTAQINTVIRHLRRAVLRQDGAGGTDGQLLTTFIEQKDEAAFEALVRRHGPMVFGVCRRVVGNHHDAEDAFQATFLVLARKAPSVRPRERVANWLHGVALRTALKAKATTAKRRGREKQVTAMPEPEAATQDRRHDLLPLLDRELKGLPENYRLPILLCDIEGKTIKEATRQLGWPQGTVTGRLARGRKLLAKRLASRGVVLSAGSLVAVLTKNVAAAAVASSLMSSTVKAACMMAAGQATVAGLVPAKVAALMEGVLNTMFMTKLKSMMAVSLAMAVMLGIGAGLLGYGTAAGQQSAGKKAEAGAPPKEVARSDKDLLQGKWLVISCECNGENRMQPWIKDNALLVIEEADGKLVCKTVFKDRAKVIELFGEGMEKWTEGTLKLDARTKPETLDFTGVHGNGTYLGIYKLDGDTLTLCQSKALTPAASESGSERPTDFSTKRGDGRSLTVYKRQEEKKNEGHGKADRGTGSGAVNERNFDTGFRAGVNSKTAPTDPKSGDSSPVPADPRTDAGKTDLDRLQGVWSVVSMESGGKPYKLGELEKAVFMVDGKRACWQTSDSETQGGLYLDTTRTPRTYDLATSTRTFEGIYALEGDTLRLCYELADEPRRPRGFVTEKGSLQVLVVLKRTHGPEVFPFRLADGTRAFPTLIEKAKTTLPQPPKLAPQPTAKVGKIIVVGNTKTDTSVIRQMIPLRPGDVLDYEALRTAEKNLAAFSPTITVEESSNSADCKDVRVTVKEK